MKRSLLGLSVLSVGLLMAQPSAAQEGSKDKVIVKKRTIVDFSDVTIEGELKKPEGDFFGSRKKTRFGSLVQARQDFRPELKESTNNL